jgi:hypothetical protein
LFIGATGGREVEALRVSIKQTTKLSIRVEVLDASIANQVGTNQSPNHVVDDAIKIYHHATFCSSSLL